MTSGSARLGRPGRPAGLPAPPNAAGRPVPARTGCYTGSGDLRLAKKLVLLDTNGLVYRAFFALPYFTTTDGRPTNAVYGFANMLLKVLEEGRPGHIAAPFA